MKTYSQCRINHFLGFYRTALILFDHNSFLFIELPVLFAADNNIRIFIIFESFNVVFGGNPGIHDNGCSSWLKQVRIPPLFFQSIDPFLQCFRLTRIAFKDLA
jgi:hypothetical protein